MTKPTLRSTPFPIPDEAPEVTRAASVPVTGRDKPRQEAEIIWPTFGDRPTVDDLFVDRGRATRREVRA